MGVANSVLYAASGRNSPFRSATNQAPRGLGQFGASREHQSPAIPSRPSHPHTMPPAPSITARGPHTSQA